MRVAHLIAPVAHRRGALQFVPGQLVGKVRRVEIRGSGADAGVVRTDVAQVVGIVLLSVDVADHVATGVHHAQQVRDLAVQGPGRALIGVLAVSRRKSSDLIACLGLARWCSVG